jgi:hypothetical protein
MRKGIQVAYAEAHGRLNSTLQCHCSANGYLGNGFGTGSTMAGKLRLNGPHDCSAAFGRITTAYC